MQSQTNEPLITWHDIRRWRDLDTWEDEEERLEKRAQRGKGKYWRRRPYHDEQLRMEEQKAG